jgi:hypothetical protein
MTVTGIKTNELEVTELHLECTGRVDFNQTFYTVCARKANGGGCSRFQIANVSSPCSGLSASAID